MSIYDNAGVALIPSGTKASKLYSVLPANGNGDFNATRGSTATRVNKDGLIESVATNVPRLDYPLIDGVVQDCPALLLEPQRRNYFTYSEDFTNGSWIKVNATVSSNNSISPDGTLNGDLIQATSTNGLAVITNFLTETQQTISVFAKSGNYDKFKMGQASNEYYAEFDLTNGSVLSVDSNLSEASINYYGNGWYRCSVRYASPSGLKTLGIVIEGSGNNVNFFGAQSEFGSYPTSYIPTSGSTATRSADACNGSGTSADFNSAEGVLFTELATLDKDDTSSRRISISDGTTNNVIRLTFDVASNRLYVVVYKLGTIWATYTTLSNSEGFNKVALKYKPSDFNFYVNGVKVQQQSSGATFDAGTMSEVAFDNGGGGNLFVGKCKQIMTFKTALNDSELETLTSWDSFNAMATGQLYTIE